MDNPIETPGTRPYGPPARAVSACRGPLLIVFGGFPLIVSIEILYLMVGDGWLNAFMPDGIPVGPVIIAIFIAISGRYFAWPVYTRRTLWWIKAFRNFVDGATLFFIILYCANLFALVTAKNADVFSFYVMGVIILTVFLPFVFILWRTTHKYRWYDPKSLPSQWELPLTSERELWPPDHGGAMSHPSETPGTRPYGPPARAINACRVPLLITSLILPTVVTIESLHLIMGDDWMNGFMPSGIPAGPIVIAIFVAVFGLYFAWPVYLKRTLWWIRAFRNFVIGSTAAFIALCLLNVFALVAAKNSDDFAFYLPCGVILLVCAPFMFRLWHTTHKYKWYDPKSLPSEWELPEALAAEPAVRDRI